MVIWTQKKNVGCDGTCQKLKYRHQGVRNLIKKSLCLQGIALSAETEQELSVACVSQRAD